MTNGANRSHVVTKKQKTRNRKKKGKTVDVKIDKVVPVLSRGISPNWLSHMGPKGISASVKLANRSESEGGKRDRNAVGERKKARAEKVIALDCEMVSDLNNDSMLARVSLVNFKLECVYDKFVKPQSKVGDYRTRFSGIREEDLANGADFETVRQEVRELLRNKILVGHALRNDFKVLKFGHHKRLIRDTSGYEPFRDANDSKSPPLKKLAKLFLNENIQEGEHNSIEDAKTAMKLYKKFRKEWEVSLLSAKTKVSSETQQQQQQQHQQQHQQYQDVVSFT